MTPANVVETTVVTFPGATAPIDKLDLADLNSRVSKMREMMLVGLAAYGEVERLSDKLKCYEYCKISVPKDLRVIRPTGSSETISDFAEALRCIDSMVLEVTRLANEASRKRPSLTFPPKPDKNTALDAFGHEVCQRTSAIRSVILSGLDLIRKDDLDQMHRQLFRASEMFDSAARLLGELSTDAVDAEVTMAKRVRGAV